MKKFDGRAVVSAKGVYLCVLTLYAILREVLAIQEIVGSSVITYGFFGIGVMLIVAMVLSDKAAFFRKTQWFPMAFLVVCCMSTIVNRRFDFMSNVKAIAWMTLYFMLLLPQSKYTAEEKRNRLGVMYTAVVTMCILVLISMPMYYFDVDYTYLKPSGFVNNQGFSRQYMRLWGVFIDTNTASTYSLVCICFAVYLITKIKKKLSRILLGADCVVLAHMLVLTNSRTALVSLLAAAAWVAVHVIFTWGKSKGRKRVVTAIIAAVLSVCVAYGVYETVKNLMPYGKVTIQSVTNSSAYVAVHKAYDRLFESSTLNITEGYYVDSTEASDSAEIQIVETQVAETQTTATESIETQTTETEANTVPSESAPANTETFAPTVESLDRTDKKADLSNGRFKKWMEVLEVVRHMPVLGASPRGISSAAKQINSNSTVAKFNFAAHNSLLEVLAGTGIVGFVVVIIILGGLAWGILRTVFSGNGTLETLLFSTVLLIMVCEMMFISDVFFVLTFGGIIFWMAAGCIFANMSGRAK